MHTTDSWLESEAEIMKVYRRHNCTKQHRKYSAAAKCIWPKAKILGDGPYASLSKCPPYYTVFLYGTEEEAMNAMAWIDECGCGGRCVRKHEVIKIADLGELRTARRREC